MIKSQEWHITLDWCEIAALDEFVISLGKNRALFFDKCSFSASLHGVTISCPNETKADEIWDYVLEAIDDC